MPHYQVALPYSSALHTFLARVQGFLLTVTTHNSTALKTNGMTEGIFIYTSFGVKNFLYLITRYKKVHVYAQNFTVCVFSFSEIHKSQYLDGCQAMGKNSSFIEAF